MPEVNDHYRPTGEDHAPGVYRVVGATARVVLLRVADAEGRRVHTGEVATVPAETLDQEFEPAGNPDAGFSPVGALRNGLQGLYWQVRRFF